MICKKCGAEVNEDVSICPNCGNDLKADKNTGMTPTVIAVIGVVLIASVAACAFLLISGRINNVRRPDKREMTAAASEAVDDNNDVKSEAPDKMDTSNSLEQETSAPSSVQEENNDQSNEEPEQVNAWAGAYYDYLIEFDRKNSDNEYDSLEYRSYDYIYVNDDDIPELLLQGRDEATGNLILTYDNGKIDELQTSRLNFDYLEKENLLRNSDGHMGYYYDYIYTIKDGKWETKEYGECYVEDNTVDWDEDDMIFEWNGKKISGSEYNEELKKVYDSSKAKPGAGILESEEILDRLRDDRAGKENEYLEDDTGINRYEVFVKDVTWDEAMKDCKSRGGHLVRLETFEEKCYVESMLITNGQEKLVFWLGGRMNPEDMHYHWFDGEKYSRATLDKDRYYKYLWLDGEPSFRGVDADGNEDDENCMCMFNVDTTVKWNDVPADISGFYKGKIAYICEYD